MDRKGSWVLLGGVIALLVLAIGAVALYARVPLSIPNIGEEGYVPYDPGLSSNTFDHARWIETPGSCDGTYGSREQSCKATLTPYAGVIVKDGNLEQSGLNFVPDGHQPTLRTTDLRLVDFKMEFQLYPGGVDGGTACWYGYCYTDTKKARSWSPVASLELRWDDYQLGHYQLFINNQLKESGIVPEGTPFYLTKQPGSTIGTQPWMIETLRWINPRVKSLFGCDLQAGEVKVHTCTSGPATITLDSLPGFKRFCPSLPATFTDAGLATSSTRVYYSLAQGNPVALTKNQIWEFQYLADSKSMKTPADKTGIVELCKGPIIIEDLKDLVVAPASVHDRVLSWTSYGRIDGSLGYKTKKLDLQSGNLTFMHTSPITIDERTCPYTAATQNYPGLPPSCFSIDAYGRTFHDGDTIAVSDGLNVTLDHLTVRYRLDDTAGNVRTWTANWKLSFAPNAVTISTPMLSSVRQGSDFSSTHLVRTDLPGAGVYLLSTGITDALTGEQETILTTTTLKANGAADVQVSLPTDTLGLHTVLITPTLQTDVGGIPFQEATANYTVVAPDSTSTTTPNVTDVPLAGASWWSRLWDWIISLFTFT